MKKKDFNSKLDFNKNIISSLQKSSLHGGTDTIVYATTYVIVNTIKITTEHFTKPTVCPDETKNGCPLSHDCTTNPPSCVRTACFC
jgi:hypothetical protein